MSLFCQACGATVQFRSTAQFRVCNECQSLLILRNGSIELIGRVAEISDDSSPLQLQTSGIFDGCPFTLIGRIRKTWDGATWNEWCVLFEDQRIGWLAEGPSELTLTFEQPLDGLTDIRSVQAFDALIAGAAVTINGQRFLASETKRVHCIGAEGELAQFPAESAAVMCVELRGSGLDFATLQRQAPPTHESTTDSPAITVPELRLFTGRIVEFGECRFTGIQGIESWEAVSRTVTAMAQDDSPQVC